MKGVNPTKRLARWISYHNGFHRLSTHSSSRQWRVDISDGRHSSGGEYVFTYKGVRIKNGIDATLRKIVKMAGLENVTLHTLRHTFASQLVMAGVPLRDVQELMGHRSFETTLRYAHLSEDHVKKQVLKLPFAGD